MRWIPIARVDLSARFEKEIEIRKANGCVYMSSSNQNTPEDRRMIFEALITEYEQLYEHARHENNARNAIQALLVTVSFGILAHTLDIDSLIGVIFAAFTANLAFPQLHPPDAPLIIRIRF